MEIRVMILEELIRLHPARYCRLYKVWDDIVTFRLIDKRNARLSFGLEWVHRWNFMPRWFPISDVGPAYRRLKQSRPLTVLFRAFEIPPPNVLSNQISDTTLGDKYGYKQFYHTHITVCLLRLHNTLNSWNREPVLSKTDPRILFKFPPPDLENFAVTGRARDLAKELLALPMDRWWVLKGDRTWCYRPTLLLSSLLAFWVNYPSVSMRMPRYQEQPMDHYGGRIFGRAFMDKWGRFVEALRWSFGLRYFLTGSSDDSFPDCTGADAYPDNHFLQSYIARYAIVFLITVVDIGGDLGGATFSQRLAELGSAVDAVYKFLRFMRSVEGYIQPPVPEPKFVYCRSGEETEEYKEYQAKRRLYERDSGNPRRGYSRWSGWSNSDNSDNGEGTDNVDEQARFDTDTLGGDFRFPELDRLEDIYPLRYKW